LVVASHTNAGQFWIHVCHHEFSGPEKFSRLRSQTGKAEVPSTIF
jgi:sterol desaturase/sphingolipid hydroxylase (fatty acid hydroxylase superfamily)